MKTFSRVAAIAGTAFALLAAAPALAQAADANAAPVCENAGSQMGGTGYGAVLKVADYCSDAEGQELTAVSAVVDHGAIQTAIAADGRSIEIKVPHMDLNREYVAEITVTDGTDTTTWIWAAVVAPRGTEPAEIVVPTNETSYTGHLGTPGDLSSFTFSLEKIEWGTGDLTIEPDGTFTYEHVAGAVGMDFYYRVSWQSKYNGEVYEVRKGSIYGNGPSNPHPSKPAKPAADKGKDTAGGKDKLADTGSPVPMIAGAGAGALALGGAGLWLARRRNAA